jgi:hypothetical protein
MSSVCFFASLHTIQGGMTMTIRELIDVLQTLPPEGDAYIVLVGADDIVEEFDIEVVHEDNGNAQIEVYEMTEESENDENKIP